ncbi:hypothetical protein NKW44_09080 [Acetobacter lovaniensis]|uniref:hypothetical protein n=1 Tax=Acetobacter lovaniensis TaxID=104100 RepID=UPI00209F4065|nr:hypothetical protein [Acetobacter lovaniensis]MCP1239846.1 hypothetical protein [Acetobacter lovaniensis]
MSLPCLTSPYLIAQNHVLPGNLRQRHKRGIGSKLRSRLLLEFCRPWGNLGADWLDSRLRAAREQEAIK